MTKPEALVKEELVLAKSIFERVKIEKNKAAALTFLLKCEPFCYHQEQIKTYLND